MGNTFQCLKKGQTALSDIKSTKDNGETNFNNLVKAVEVPENEKNFWIYFKYTFLPSVDDVIYKAQCTVNDLHKLRSELIKGMTALLRKTQIWEIKGADTSHAILALIYAISAQTKGAATEKFLTFGGKFPYFKIGKDSAELNVAKDSKILFDYFHCLEKAYTQMPKIVKDCLELSEKAADLKDTAKDDLERVDKFKLNKCMSALNHNITRLKRLKNLANVTMELVTKSAKELEHAYKIIQEESTSLPEFGQILADEGKSTPKECYERVGKKIEAPENVKTEEEMFNFPYDKSGKKGEKDGDDDESEHQSNKGKEDKDEED